MYKKLIIIVIIGLFVNNIYGQASIVKLTLPQECYKITFEPKPQFFFKDSVVYYPVFDDVKLKIILTDTVDRHKTLIIKYLLKPFSINTITIIEKNKRKLKVKSEKTIYYLPKIRCKQRTHISIVERSIVDMMLIEHDNARFMEAKKFIRNHCLSFSQVKGLIMMFPSDKQRLELAEYAYFFVRDFYNYFLLKNCFKSKDTYADFEHFVRNIDRNFKL